jgi:hypothetical protein
VRVYANRVSDKKWESILVDSHKNFITRRSVINPIIPLLGAKNKFSGKFFLKVKYAKQLSWERKLFLTKRLAQKSTEKLIFSLLNLEGYM